MSHRRWSFLFLATIICTIGLARPVVAAEITVTDLGILGCHYSRASAVNDLGQVVGETRLPNCGFRAFFWSKERGMADLGTLEGSTSPIFESIALDINNKEQVVGRSSTSLGLIHGFLWTLNSGMRDIGTLGGTYSAALAINDMGQVVGVSTTTLEETHAFIWTATDGMRDIGKLSGTTECVARDINNYGQAVGMCGFTTGRFRAFLWSADSGMVDLGTLGDTNADAYAINDHGQIVGQSGHVFLWQQGNLSDLGTLGWSTAEPHSINNQGVIVGMGSLEPSGPPRAFSWSQGSGIMDLGSIYDSGYAAYDNNNRGQIVGIIGMSSGESRAALWTVPLAPTYYINILYDQARPIKLGSTLAIRLQLWNAQNANVSSANIVLHTVKVTRISTTADGPVQDAGNANPDNNFRYDATLGGTGGYIFNLSTKGLSTGAYTLSFTVGNDPTTYSVQFEVK